MALFRKVQSFQDVPITEEGVAMEPFLEASDGLMQIFDLFGYGVFTFVKKDLRSNIEGVRSRHASKQSESGTLEKFIDSEITLSKDERKGTGCLLRLLRGLAFTSRSLQNSLDNPEEDLHVSFKRAYDSTLKRHHKLAVRTIVGVAIRATPRRHDFYTCIAQGEPQETLQCELRKWLEALDGIVARMVVVFENLKPGVGLI